MRKLVFSVIALLMFFSAELYSQTYEELVNRAIDYQEAADYVAAEQVLKEAMRKEPANPGNTLLLSNLGTIQRVLGKYSEALLSYSAALGRHPNAVFVLQNRASLFCEIDSIDKALQDYNAILLIDENNVDALYRRGLVHIDRKNLLAAENDFEKIKQNSPENLLASSGIALLMKRRGEWDKAEELYSDLIYKNKSNADLYLNRAECYLETKRLARTQEDLNKALSLGNTSPFLFIMRGRLKLEQFDKFSAREDFSKAKELGANASLIDDFLKFCK